MAYHKTDTVDPTWGVKVTARKAVLWLGPSIQSSLQAHPESALSVFTRSWHSIYLDSFNPSDLLTTASESAVLEPLTLRTIAGDPDDAGRLAANRIPAYQVPSVDPTEDPRGYAARLKMFQRIPNQAILFALVMDPGTDLPSLRQALRTTGEVEEVVVISPTAPSIEMPAARSVYWRASLADLAALVSGLAAPSDIARTEATLVIQTNKGLQAVDFSRAVDASNPITDRFSFIPASAVLADIKPDENQVKALLTAPTASWTPYAAGVAYDRVEPFEADVRRLLKDFRERGPDATCTAWIDAEQASGSTTLLRSLLFKLARDGFPVLVARPDATTFDFQQLAIFFRAAAALADDSGGRLGESPWIIAFDAEHTTRSDDFVVGVANGLRKLNRAALVIALRPMVPSAGDGRMRATGLNRTLGKPLLNVLSQHEIQRFGEHINKFLPPHQRRRSDEWTEFSADSERLTGDGKQSLFWLALRFWLLRLPGSDEPLRQWLATRIKSSVAGAPDRVRAVLVIAALSRHRLACPGRLLTADERRSLLPILDDPAQPLGLRELWGERRGSFAFAHPLIAEELLRICSGDSNLLKDASISQCAGLFDFELQLFEQMLPRSEAGFPEVIPVIEELVTSALRVDPREAPRNYSARERIVMLLERVPDEVFDASQIFLHHLAKARRHLAADPPETAHWSDPAAIREQLVLAESHLKEATTSVQPDDEERREKPLNLHVSLALTYTVRAEFEKTAGQFELADKLADQAQHEYQLAQTLDPDNTYVLENYARLKLRQAREATDETTRLELLVDAISLLEWELAVDEHKRRETAVFEVLTSAYVFLDERLGLARVENLAQSGSEAATVAFARLLATPERIDPDTIREPEPDRAIDLLKAVPPSRVTWRSRLLLYQLLSLRTPHAFAERIEPLDELETMRDFPWPLQTRFEYAILLYQMGRHRDGQAAFQKLRDVLASRSSALFVPSELRFLADVRTGFQSPLRTSMRVTNATNVGRNFFGIPDGWGAVDVPFRPYLFGRKQIRNNDDLDCLIQFTSFGPQAVPPTEA